MIHPTLPKAILLREIGRMATKEAKRKVPREGALLELMRQARDVAEEEAWRLEKGR